MENGRNRQEGWEPGIVDSAGQLAIDGYAS